MYKELTNIYQLNKTLKFELIPQKETLEHIRKNGLIYEDEIRAKNFAEVKKIINDYHKEHINESLKDAHISCIDEFANIYLTRKKTKDKEKKKELLKDLEASAQVLRKQVALFLKTPEEKYKILTTNKKLIEEVLPEWVAGDEEKLEYLNQFKNFTSYFALFTKGREHIYSDKDKSGSISYRIIDQNLPKFIDNYENLLLIIDNDEMKETLDELERDFQSILNGKSLEEFFRISAEIPDDNNYNAFLTQDGITLYNTVIGGYTKPDGEKVKGVNEIINIYNQRHKKDKDITKIGLMKPLFKQILSDRESLSFVPDTFNSDKQILDCLKAVKDDITNIIQDIDYLFQDFDTYDLDRVYIKNEKQKESLSQIVYHSWNFINSKIIEDYDSKQDLSKVRSWTNYEKRRKTALNKEASYSIEQLTNICEDNSIETFYKHLHVKTDRYAEAEPICQIMTERTRFLEILLDKDCPEDNTLLKEDRYIEIIKDYLDTVKAIQRLIRPFDGVDFESDKDERFYGEFTTLFEELKAIMSVYDKIRNYITRKPYSKEKIKLNFGYSNFLSGWHINKSSEAGGILLRKDGNYYLGVINKKNATIFKHIEPAKTDDVYQHLEYRTLPNMKANLKRIAFAASNEELFKPSERIKTIIESGIHLKESPDFCIKACREVIDFYKSCLKLNPSWSVFDIELPETDTYESINDFYEDVARQTYHITFGDIDASVIDTMVKNDELYLFKIHCKDFSPHSKGLPNLFTLYWNAIFDPTDYNHNIRLNGNGEMFFRKKSIDPANTIIHRKNEPIANKNPNSKKRKNTFPYDIIKDYRYTVDKFELHIPITLNSQAENKPYINERIKKLIKDTDDIYVIGIDRGERNLIYVSVIDPKGNIIEQKSLNIIRSYNKGNTCITDYKELLSKREKERDQARKSWKTIESIKELKEGYLSQVVHEITNLVVKYNAIVVMENLNSGFKQSRSSIETQVYQNFEKMLINKLNYFAGKVTDTKQPGGILNAYQLTNKFVSFEKLGTQSGIIFYTQPWNTSKIDPVTGFVNMFDTRYKTIEKAQTFWNNFNEIYYDADKDMFAFDFDYANFTHKGEETREKWTVYSNGDRIVSVKNEHGNWDQSVLNPTEELKKLFTENSIDYTNGNLKDSIVDINSGKFQKSLMYFFKVILQMRNSKTNSVKPEDDYIISPVMDENGEFFDSRNTNSNLPDCADANGAYNIARKGLMIVNRIKNTPEDDLKKIDLFIMNKDWLKYAQNIE